MGRGQLLIHEFMISLVKFIEKAESKIKSKQILEKILRLSLVKSQFCVRKKNQKKARVQNALNFTNYNLTDATL